MTNNAIISGFLSDLLNILDARTWVDIFLCEGEDKQSILRCARVYELLANDEFMQTYGRYYKVVGLTLGMSTSIMITKERF